MVEAWLEVVLLQCSAFYSALRPDKFLRVGKAREKAQRALSCLGDVVSFLSYQLADQVGWRPL